jgi:predicted extracellular nuclease
LKKTFLLTDPKKDPQRVLEAIKSNIKKYIKREKRKELPEGSNFWKIDCKFGLNKEDAKEIRFEDIMKNINEVSEQKSQSFYIELNSTASNMNFKKKEKETKIETNNEVII